MIEVDWNSLLQKRGKKDKNIFPTGSRVYVGYQGDGKTLSMVHDAIELSKQMPCAIYSNLKLKNIKYQFLDSDNDLSAALAAQTPQGLLGSLILLDEAHLFFNKKKGIPIEVLTAISQQRKDRKRICFTSQIWEEMDLSIRKQVKEIVRCRRFGCLQINHITDGESLKWDDRENEWVGKSLGYKIFKHTEPLYQSFDTRQKIFRNNEYINNRAGGGTTSQARLP